jgi:hypothetical protein
VHAALIEKTQKGRLIGYISRDATPSKAVRKHRSDLQLRRR